MAGRRKPKQFDEVTAVEEEAMRALREELHALYDAVLDEPAPPALVSALKKHGDNQ